MCLQEPHGHLDRAQLKGEKIWKSILQIDRNENDKEKKAKHVKQPISVSVLSCSLL